MAIDSGKESDWAEVALSFMNNYGMTIWDFGKLTFEQFVFMNSRMSSGKSDTMMNRQSQRRSGLGR